MKVPGVCKGADCQIWPFRRFLHFRMLIRQAAGGRPLRKRLLEEGRAARRALVRGPRRPVEEVQRGIDLLELLFDFVALVDGCSLFESLQEPLLSRQQVLDHGRHDSLAMARAAWPDGFSGASKCLRPVSGNPERRLSSRGTDGQATRLTDEAHSGSSIISWAAGFQPLLSPEPADLLPRRTQKRFCGLVDAHAFMLPVMDHSIATMTPVAYTELKRALSQR